MNSKKLLLFTHETAINIILSRIKPVYFLIFYVFENHCISVTILYVNRGHAVA
jgi:hypothetical protein